MQVLYHFGCRESRAIRHQQVSRFETLGKFCVACRVMCGIFFVQAVVDANPGLHTCRSLQRTVIIGGCLSLLEVSCCCKRLSHKGWPATG